MQFPIVTAAPTGQGPVPTSGGDAPMRGGADSFATLFGKVCKGDVPLNGVTAATSPAPEDMTLPAADDTAEAETTESVDDASASAGAFIVRGDVPQCEASSFDTDWVADDAPERRASIPQAIPVDAGDAAPLAGEVVRPNSREADTAHPLPAPEAERVASQVAVAVKPSSGPLPVTDAARGALALPGQVPTDPKSAAVIAPAAAVAVAAPAMALPHSRAGVQATDTGHTADATTPAGSGEGPSCLVPDQAVIHRPVRAAPPPHIDPQAAPRQTEPPPDPSRQPADAVPDRGLQVGRTAEAPPRTVVAEGFSTDPLPQPTPLSRDSVAGTTPSAEPGAQRPQTPLLAQHVAQQISVSLRQTSDRVTELALDPVELGKVRMTVRAQDQAIVMTVVADRPETADLMRRHVDVLQQEFRALGYTSVTLDFSAGQGQGAFDQSGRAKGGIPGDTSSDTTTDPVAAIAASAVPARGANGSLDLRL